MCSAFLFVSGVVIIMVNNLTSIGSVGLLYLNEQMFHSPILVFTSEGSARSDLCNAII